MGKYFKIVVFFILFTVVSKESKAQVYLGGGGVISQFSSAALEEYRGIGAIVQRQIYLKDSRLSLTPTLQGSWLTDKQYNENFSEFYTSVSVGVHLNYDLLSFNKFRFAPFAGPSFVWVTGTDAGVLAPVPQAVNFYRFGLEVGASMTYFHSEKFSIKLIPLTYTFSNKEFVQGNVLSLLFQIM